MLQAKGYAALDAKKPLEPHAFERRAPGPEDVVLEILFCGICHSDIHAVNNDWGSSRYPLVPGHEIVGRVTEVGSQVTRFAAGDLAGVGCFIDSCRQCAACEEDDEHYCVEGFTATYGSVERSQPDLATYGGYSNNYVLHEHFALKIDPALDLAATAPLLCAGITTYSPLRHWKIGKGQRVGVVGLGGLGHMGVKFAKAFGAEVVMFTTSESKADAARELGADEVVLSTDRQAMKTQRGKLDFILDTVSAQHDLNAYLKCLKRDGVLCLVGLPDKPLGFSPFLTAGRRIVTGSMLGGIAETQEMLDFCAEHGIVSDIELIDIASVNKAYERVLSSDVKYRFVIDMATLDS